jgi:hypothetical protein
VEEVKREMAEVTAEEARRYRDGLAPKLAEYMLAARRVYQEGADAEAVRRQGSLDGDVLSRWVEYLKPSKERRAHLEPWYEAKPEELSAVAGRYQKDFLAVIAEREKARAEWKAKAAAAKARGEEPPEPPKFQPGDHRFFTEVTTAKGPFALPDKDAERFYSQAGREALAAHKAELQRLKDATPPEPPFACGVAEGKNVEQHVFVRGNPESPGDLVSKRFPTILAGQDQAPITQGSGRKELAEWLSRGSVPLVARVMVNRIWQGHFGEGLVRTPSNFGLTGERPSHPELLDWLAGEFMARGWSIKAMHRLMMLSSAYRMSGEPVNAASIEKDPGNLLLSRFPMRRLTVEEIRDSLLTLDGSLDLTIGGAMQTGEGTDKEFSEARKSLSPDESRRRTVYLPLRRSNLPSLLTLYDFGDATTSNEARAQTNVAPQALYMMNSTFVERRAQALARKLAASIPGDEQRVERAYFLVLGRNPEAGEVAAALEYLRGFPAKGGQEGAWASFCQALLASNDFIYVH